MTDQPNATRFATLAIHAGIHPDAMTDPRATPLGQASSLGFGGDHAASLFGLRNAVDNANPINAILEERVAALEGGSAALAVASGRAAQVVAFSVLMRPGDEIVASRGLNKDLIAQCDHGFQAFGWQIRWADPSRPESFVDALSDKTKAIFCESIADLGGTVTDLEAIARIAQRARVPMIVDNTLATPYLVRPLEHGADIVVHSANTFLGGPGVSSGGFVVDGGTFDWAGDGRFPALSEPCPGQGGTVLADTFGNYAFAVACRTLGLREIGSTLSPSDGFLILTGVETLPLRMQRHCDNALAVARHLSRHPAVSWVRYAGLDGDPDHSLAQRYCPRGAGAVFTFGLTGGYDAGAVLTKRLKLFSRDADVGSTRSLVFHQASRSASGGEGFASAVGPDAVRVSIGIEDKDDIIADLDQALAA